MEESKQTDVDKQEGGASMYQIIDKKTGKTVGRTYKDRVKARRKADALDNEYGAYRYYVKTIAE